MQTKFIFIQFYRWIMTRPKSIYDKYQDSKHYAKLDRDKKIQKQYKSYVKMAGKKSMKMTKEQYYDFNHPRVPKKAESKPKVRVRSLRTRGK